MILRTIPGIELRTARNELLASVTSRRDDNSFSYPGYRLCVRVRAFWGNTVLRPRE